MFRVRWSLIVAVGVVQTIIKRTMAFRVRWSPIVAAGVAQTMKARSSNPILSPVRTLAVGKMKAIAFTRNPRVRGTREVQSTSVPAFEILLANTSTPQQVDVAQSDHLSPSRTIQVAASQ